MLVFGTFDALHPGHIHFLRQARKHGSWLVASVARDQFVRNHKQREPFEHEAQRLLSLLDSGLVDEAYFSDEEVGSFEIVRSSRPDVICVGHDQGSLKKHLEEWLQKHRLDIPVKPMVSHHPERYKTSKIIPTRRTR